MVKNDDDILDGFYKPYLPLPLNSGGQLCV